ncbi:alpha-1A adrenergic receptor-like [Hydractinia symbiolongicarpus]|uniref:alpha-1A adrenergic receptor-like n=1 Tax=Hydractinia symbiolongicarpus TaxID=13093 RepID=UPI002551535D|nr:alpha-1A adrenergic receptor-like [Hydractinia symbiolongicarpus]
MNSTSNITSCEQLVQELHVSEGLTHYVVRKLLPHICALVDINNANTTASELLFHDLCCDPIPSVMLNGTVGAGNTHSNTDQLLHDLCHHLSTSSMPGDAAIYRNMCHPTTHPTQTLHLYHQYEMLSMLCLIIGTPIGFLANLLVLMTVYKVKRLRNTTGYFISNLAIADILVIFEMIFFVILFNTGAMVNANVQVKKFIFSSMDVAFGAASLLHATGSSIERAIAVSMPLKYPRYLSERRAKHVIQTLWSYSFLLFLFGIFRIWIDNQTYEVVYFCIAAVTTFFIPCILVLISYSFIMTSALKNIKMEQKITRVIVMISLMNQSDIHKASSTRPARCREIKIAMNVAIMTVPFVFVWGNFMICQMYEVSTDKHVNGLENWLVTYSPFIISCVNPFAYLMFTRSLRKSSWKILRQCFGVLKSRERLVMRRESYVTSMAPSVPDETTTLTENEPIQV